MPTPAEIQKAKEDAVANETLRLGQFNPSTVYDPKSPYRSAVNRANAEAIKQFMSTPVTKGGRRTRRTRRNKRSRRNLFRK